MQPLRERVVLFHKDGKFPPVEVHPVDAREILRGGEYTRDAPPGFSMDSLPDTGASSQVVSDLMLMEGMSQGSAEALISLSEDFRSGMTPKAAQMLIDGGYPTLASLATLDEQTWNSLSKIEAIGVLEWQAMTNWRKGLIEKQQRETEARIKLVAPIVAEEPKRGPGRPPKQASP